MSTRSSQNYRQTPQNQQNKGFNNNKPQRRYIPKPQNQSTNPPLSTSLRQTDPSPATSAINSNSNPSSSSSSSSSSRVHNNHNNGGGNGKFVNYLPQDEAVATGLGVEDGALDPIESQRVVDLLNTELSRLLKCNPRDFWKQVASDTSLHDFLDSFLQFRKRWYDFPYHGAKDLVAGVVVGELELSRRVFMVLYRTSSNRDPGALVTDSLSVKDHEVLLQDKKLLDLPKLLDICAIYGHENEELTRALVNNAMQSQAILHGNLSASVSRFLSVVHTMHQRCESLLETLGSQDEHGKTQLITDFLEVMDFINDAVVSLDAFVKSYKSAALYFLCPSETSHGNDGELLGTLAKLHDSLLPALQRGIGTGGGPHSDTFKILSMRIIDFFWRLLDICYLNSEVFEGSLPFLNATKMFPSNVEDPGIRGDILLQTFRDINANKTSGSLLQKVQNHYNILSRLEELRNHGWIFMESDQLQYLSLILKPTSESMKKDSNMSRNSNKVQMDESVAIMESEISQIKDLFPDYGKGFLGACLEAYNHNPEEVIQRILEGTLHEELQSMDISLDKIPPPKPAQAQSLSKKDKGKGVVGEERRIEGTSSSALSSSSSSTRASHLSGRFTRKTLADVPNPKTLDSRDDVETTMKTSLLASQYEYEDEYDDSFDDLGLSVVESGYEDSENSSRSKMSGPEKESTAGPNRPGPKWNTKKGPQFYVKDGKNYSYNVPGSVAVSDTKEAALVNEAHKEVINGLGRGGNLPLGAVKRLQESNQAEDEDGDGEGDGSEMGGGGGGRGRGRGRRGGGGGGRHNNYRKDRAMKKHFASVGGF